MKRKIGRPTTATKPGEKTTLTLRVPSGLKRRLDGDAKAAGIHLSEEAERRLAGSYQHQALLEPALELAYGPQLAALLLILGRVMSTTGRRAMFLATQSPENLDGWLSNPYAFDQVASATKTILEGIRPQGDREFPAPPKPYATSFRPAHVGDDTAIGTLALLADPTQVAPSDSAEYLDARAFALEQSERLGPNVAFTVPKRRRSRRRPEDGGE